MQPTWRISSSPLPQCQGCWLRRCFRNTRSNVAQKKAVQSWHWRLVASNIKSTVLSRLHTYWPWSAWQRFKMCDKVSVVVHCHAGYNVGCNCQGQSGCSELCRTLNWPGLFTLIGFFPSFSWSLAATLNLQWRWFGLLQRNIMVCNANVFVLLMLQLLNTSRTLRVHDCKTRTETRR